MDDADTEPRVPVGLGNLNGALRAVADFLDIDQDLLAVAAQASPDAQEADRSRLAEWIASLPSEEKDALLARVASGDGIAVQALLARRFRRAHCGSEPAASARTAAQLWKAAGERKAEREKAEEERRREQRRIKGAEPCRAADSHGRSTHRAGRETGDCAVHSRRARIRIACAHANELS